MSDVVLTERRDGVATLTLNRPDRLNAWTPEMGRVYFDLLDDCAAREDVRVIVVTGAGRAGRGARRADPLRPLAQRPARRGRARRAAG